MCKNRRWSLRKGGLSRKVTNRQLADFAPHCPLPRYRSAHFLCLFLRYPSPFTSVVVAPFPTSLCYIPMSASRIAVGSLCAAVGQGSYENMRTDHNLSLEVVDSEVSLIWLAGGQHCPFPRQLTLNFCLHV
jgi:hypothetical protein